MGQKTLNVAGMSCQSCVNKIEGNIRELNGVDSVKVLLADGKVDVTFQEKIIQLDTIQKAVEELGYEVTEETTGGSCQDSCCN